MSVDAIDLVEANEAIFTQSMVVVEDLGFPADKVNVNGGSNCLRLSDWSKWYTNSRYLIHEMKDRQNKYGLASLCISGGQGVATIIKNER